MFRQRTGFGLIVSFILTMGFQSAAAQPKQAQHAQRADMLVITDAMMVDGVATPAEGPVDIIIRGNRIERIARAKANAEHRLKAEAVIPAKGKYVLPGFINLHAHLMDSRAGQDMPFQYQYNLWLGCGITTIRDVGSDPNKAVVQREKSARNDIIAPRMFLYMWFSSKPDEASIRKRIRELKKLGADGLKFHQLDRETFSIAADEARKQGLRIAHHVGVEDANAWDDIRAGTTSIEHWYGVPDAALNGVQHFPPDFNYANELDRFRYAGRLWREVNRKKLRKVLKAMVDAGVAWNPTFAIYEACRDLQRAITKPWFNDYLHPALADFFTPDPNYHGSFFFGWTNTDEVFWKENYRIWMRAVLEFARMGGTVGAGEDAGFIYEMFGFGFLRELELHEEAGFQPLEVIQHATHNGAKILGKDKDLGRIKPGYLADLVVVNGNPLENLHILYPKGIHPILDQQRGDRGGIEWTIKDGIPYHAPTLLKKVREMVKKAREAKKKS